MFHITILAYRKSQWIEIDMNEWMENTYFEHIISYIYLFMFFLPYYSHYVEFQI